MATAKDIMNRRVFTIDRNATAMDAIEKMNNERVSSETERVSVSDIA